MATTAVKPKTPGAVGSTTDADANKNLHSFCGDTVEIKLLKADKHETVQQFVGLNNYQAVIQREKWVRIPVEVADHIESLMFNDLEPNPDFPDDRSKDTWVERPRFPMQRRP